MEKILLKPLEHRGNLCIGIYFRKNQALQSVLQKDAGARWSRTHSCWYIIANAINYSKLRNALDPRSAVELSQDIKKVIDQFPVQTTIEVAPPLSKGSNVAIPAESISLSGGRIDRINITAIDQFKRELTLRGYSGNTRRTYQNEFCQFLIAIQRHSAEEFTSERLKDYLQYCADILKLSENTIHSRMNALKFYYEKVLGREKFFWVIPRPKKKQQLPKVFSQNEIAAIINSVKNKKHKVMLMLAYSGGLRVSEVINLKTYQVDSSRMTIFISQSKGKKDRVVTLSPVLLVMLREYAMEYKPDKKGYLFEGNKKGTPYSTRSLQEVLQHAKRKAGIMKPGSIHSLRHSFATHLIEKGTDVTMIQKLLGHNDLKTTMIYLHTSNKDLLKIISPLDDLDLT